MQYDNPQQNTAAYTYFSGFYTGAIWDMMVEETHRYHDQIIPDHQLERKRPWHPVTKDEMKAFVGVMLLMGIVREPRLIHYWSNDKFLHHVGITSVFPVNRFQQIWRYFHLSDNDRMPAKDDPNYDRVYRVRNFLNILSDEFSRKYRLRRDIVINESMTSFQGRVG